MNASKGMLRYTFLGSGFLLAARLLVGCTAGTSGDLQQAHDLLKGGDFLGARRVYAHVVERLPRNFSAQYGLGMTWCAEALYRTELGMAQPTDWYPAIYHVSTASNLVGGQGPEVKSTMAILHFNLGACYRKLKDNGSAAERLEQALSYDSTVLKALNLLGAIYHETGDLDKAEKCYRRAVAARPDYALAHFNLGAVSWARGEYDSCRTHFWHALELDPDNGYFRSWLAKIPKQ